MRYCKLKIFSTFLSSCRRFNDLWKWKYRLVLENTRSRNCLVCFQCVTELSIVILLDLFFFYFFLFSGEKKIAQNTRLRREKKNLRVENNLDCLSSAFFSAPFSPNVKFQFFIFFISLS